MYPKPKKLTFLNCGRTSRPFHRQREWITVARVSENMAPNPVLRTQNIPRMHDFPSSSKQDKCKDPCPPPPQSRKEAEIHNYTPKFRTRLTFDCTVQRASDSLNSPMLRGQVGGGTIMLASSKIIILLPKSFCMLYIQKWKWNKGCRAKGAGVN